MAEPWTAEAALPGGDMINGDFEAFLARLKLDCPWLPGALAYHYARLYGTRAAALIGTATNPAELGRHFGGLLHEREIVYLQESEWALTAEDILHRRTKHGLHLTADQRQAVQDFIGA